MAMWYISQTCEVYSTLNNSLITLLTTSLSLSRCLFEKRTCFFFFFFNKRKGVYKQQSPSSFISSLPLFHNLFLIFRIFSRNFFRVFEKKKSKQNKISISSLISIPENLFIFEEIKICILQRFSLLGSSFVFSTSFQSGF